MNYTIPGARFMPNPPRICPDDKPDDIMVLVAVAAALNRKLNRQTSDAERLAWLTRNMPAGRCAWGVCSRAAPGTDVWFLRFAAMHVDMWPEADAHSLAHDLRRIASAFPHDSRHAHELVTTV